MKKALITGMTGMVGSHLADYILEHTDWDVIGMQRWRSPLDNIMHLMPRINAKDRVFVEYGDLNDMSSLLTVLNKVKPDYIFHLAAQSYPQTSFTAPIDTLGTNILGTCRLLDAVKQLGLDPVIHVCASSEVFGRVSADKLPIDAGCAVVNAATCAAVFNILLSIIPRTAGVGHKQSDQHAGDKGACQQTAEGGGRC